MLVHVCFCEWSRDHRDLHGRTHSFPTRRSSDLSVLSAIPLLVPCTRTTAASPPGRWMVLAPTMWSYCSHIQRRLAISGEPISFSRSVAISVFSGTSFSVSRFGVAVWGRSSQGASLARGASGMLQTVRLEEHTV